ncbi:hypothetical protein P4O66_018887 [Electrophorus voltai]|uniref:Uncharacterized protein n=1 Tax=Electrophorus voltai TaxID=2609070 RepID=A0AAD8YTN8_9TELE|nr:hypothetical protein P4O66_018887 [Electrophorus voltai]
MHKTTSNTRDTTKLGGAPTARSCEDAHTRVQKPAPLVECRSRDGGVGHRPAEFLGVSGMTHRSCTSATALHKYQEASGTWHFQRVHSCAAPPVSVFKACLSQSSCSVCCLTESTWQASRTLDLRPVDGNGPSLKPEGGSPVPHTGGVNYGAGLGFTALAGFQTLRVGVRKRRARRLAGQVAYVSTEPPPHPQREAGGDPPKQGWSMAMASSVNVVERSRGYAVCDTGDGWECVA